MFYNIFYNEEDKQREEEDYDGVLEKKYGVNDWNARYYIFEIAKDNSSKEMTIEDDLIEWVMKHEDIEDKLK